jgi:hypothetical protein
VTAFRSSWDQALGPEEQELVNTPSASVISLDNGSSAWFIRRVSRSGLPLLGIVGGRVHHDVVKNEVLSEAPS